jgi:lipopolysaccharide transport system permease protein
MSTATERPLIAPASLTAPAAEGPWDIVITPEGSSFRSRLGEMWRYRDLVLLFVRRDFVANYKQTVLGPLWFIISPIVSVAVFWFVFGNLAQLSTDGLPPILFYFTGIMCWSFFSGALLQTSASFRDNAVLFGKIYFPRLLIPISLIITHLIKLGTQFAVLLVFMGYFIVGGLRITPSAYTLLVPVLILIMCALALGGGLLMSAVSTKYRDLVMLFAGILQVLMYVTPVAYPLSAVPAGFAKVMALNPMTPIIEAMRRGLLGEGTIGPGGIIYGLIIAVLVLAAGVAAHGRVERDFVDIV